MSYNDEDGPALARAVTPTDEIRAHLTSLVERLGEQRGMLARERDEITRRHDECHRELDRCQMLLDALDKQVAIDREGEKNVRAYADEMARPELRDRDDSDLDVVRRAAGGTTGPRWQPS